MRTLRISLALALLAPVACVACVASVYDPPEWVSTPPVDADYLYAIGSYIGSLHPEDDLAHAIDAARGMLSKNISSRVTNETTVRENEHTSRMKSETTVNADFVLKNSELLQSWTDYQGNTGRRGTVWVLMRIAKPQ